MIRECVYAPFFECEEAKEKGVECVAARGEEKEKWIRDEKSIVYVVRRVFLIYV